MLYLGYLLIVILSVIFGVYLLDNDKGLGAPEVLLIILLLVSVCSYVWNKVFRILNRKD